MQRTSLLLLSLLIFGACKKPVEGQKPVCMYTCEVIPIVLMIDATLYAQEEMDTVILQKYTGDGTFTEKVGPEWTKTLVDSGQYVIVYEDIHSGSDLEIKIPGAGQTYRVQGVVPVSMSRTFEGDNCESGHFQCDVYTEECTVSGGNYQIDHSGATSITLKH